MKLATTHLLALPSLFALLLVALAQTGGFTLQAERGRALSLELCAACHGASLAGRYGPPLSGPRFLEHWKGKSAKELGQFIARRMPLGRAGILNEAQTLELLAYILQANGYPAAGAELRMDGLDRLVIGGP
ncbi:MULTISPECIES: cytochrome c [unclassified Meiothermus]|uniref:c-type cytochrome n=1 Tax=unclassified Meiothermus TaxID=370471 RepID=UPI001F185F89|nr:MULTISPECIES: cytochrome c [unclassified Meiothermus]